MNLATKFLLTLFCTIISLSIVACGEVQEEDDTKDSHQPATADVTDVSAKASTSGFTFSVTISSPDIGCDQYADWWEVVDQEGKLLYRRILAHSHVDEQPFTRSGGAVTIAENEEVWIRAHMNTGGYGGKTYFGSPATGFTEKSTPDDFAPELEDEAPQPGDCAF
ncbi:MAG: hypothetical protein WBA74_02365 [Cyclobacteriaceae bacterium]